MEEATGFGAGVVMTTCRRGLALAILRGALGGAMRKQASRVVLKSHNGCDRVLQKESKANLFSTYRLESIVGKEILAGSEQGSKSKGKAHQAKLR